MSYIVEVVRGGPADKAGLQAGDRIVSMDGSEVATQSDLAPDAEPQSRRHPRTSPSHATAEMQTVNVTLGRKGRSQVAENSKKKARAGGLLSHRLSLLV